MIDDGSMMLAGSVEGVREADFADIGSESHSKCLRTRVEANSSILGSS